MEPLNEQMFSRLKSFFSPQRSQSARNHLRKSLERGPVYDFKEITNTNGKVWSQIKIDNSIRTIPFELKFGNNYAIDIFRRNRVTLLAVSYSTFSDPAIETFIKEAPENLAKLIVRPVLNPVKWILWSKLIGGSRENSFSIFGDLPGSIEVFGMENKYAGYAFLIDAFGAIRWKAAGPATPEELKEFHKTIKMLLSA